ncbi:MAG: hypothetical protein JJE37_05605 [Methyloceanibacter sp.]|nr:hypothetical protein [Methyloceanibacter sp.]
MKIGTNRQAAAELAWIVRAANDLEQAQGRVFQALRRLVEASPLLRREAKIVANKISFPATGAVITAISSDYAGAAGANPTLSRRFGDTRLSARTAFLMNVCHRRLP